MIPRFSHLCAQMSICYMHQLQKEYKIISKMKIKDACRKRFHDERGKVNDAEFVNE